MWKEWLYGMSIGILVLLQGSVVAYALSGPWSMLIPIAWMSLCTVWLLRKPTGSSVAWMMLAAGLYEAIYLPSFGVLIIAAGLAGLVGIYIVPRLSAEQSTRSLLIVSVTTAATLLVSSLILSQLVGLIRSDLPAKELSTLSMLGMCVTVCTTAICTIVMYWFYQLYAKSVS